MLVFACKKAPVPQGPFAPVTMPDGLVWQTLVAGDGDEAKADDKVEVLYVAKTLDGGVVDASQNGHVFAFWVGQGMVIKGWDEGVLGMREGELRRLTVPPALGYGSRPPDRRIPPGETLVFEVQLVDVR